MNSRTIFKIKDSVDLFLSNEKYIIVYFMNSRQRKSFRVNDDMLRLFELIDGEKTSKHYRVLCMMILRSIPNVLLASLLRF